jgi:cell division septation protein DedD
MPSTDCATEDLQIETAMRPSAGTSKPLKGLFFGFAATVTVGLALASWYVGVRIVAADEIAPSSPLANTPVSVATAPQPAVVPQAATVNSMPQASWYSLPPAVLYLQVAGLGPKRDAGFVRTLHSRGFHAQVETRDDNTSRVLIGPFSTHAEMELAQRKLQGAGVLAVETAH